jgi:hypothetical protein
MAKFPLTVFFEFDLGTYDYIPWWKSYGVFKGEFENGYFRRIWFGCFALAFVRMSLYDYNRYVGSGLTEWRK